ncbi:MAG: hypothetical protein WC551_06080 [Patescibacteria group bacterium]
MKAFILAEVEEHQGGACKLVARRKEVAFPGRPLNTPEVSELDYRPSAIGGIFDVSRYFGYHFFGPGPSFGIEPLGSIHQFFGVPFPELFSPFACKGHG